MMLLICKSANHLDHINYPQYVKRHYIYQSGMNFGMDPVANNDSIFLYHSPNEGV